ncbi:MAG: hypothetical protein IJC59_06080 [Lachnospiraceae bacterium]|nr:hypothetical protein [Lachnospiraceae bacterium]
MKAEKKVIGSLNKCYSIAPLFYQGKEHFLVAAEKQDPCYLFDAQGNKVDQVWEGPGGVMTMVQVPGTDGQFLSTYRFYSPNDSKESKIVIVTPRGKGDWEIRTLVELPHVHRFDILQSGGVSWLIACALKSGHSHKDDWSMPGKVYVARLPEDLSVYNDDHQLPLTVLKDGLLKNHGYYRLEEQDGPAALVCSENGVFRFTPPRTAEGQWQTETLLETPASDAVLVDLDEDGVRELCVMAPFHGDEIAIYRQEEGSYRKVYEFPEKRRFLHSIYGGMLAGRPAFVVGHREEQRSLLAIRYDKTAGTYYYESIDEGCGPANVYHYEHDGKEILIATNREINEIAMYTF